MLRSWTSSSNSVEHFRFSHGLLIFNVSVEALCHFFSDEANAFLKANEQRGKALETTYEQIREQDLNDLEALVKRRNQMRFSRSLKRLI